MPLTTGVVMRGKNIWDVDMKKANETESFFNF
jgi:hypothetical protein